MTTTKRKLPSDYLAQGWCQSALARNTSDESVPVRSPDARAWCLYGAVALVLFKDGLQTSESMAIDTWLRSRGYSGWWNDAPSRTQAEVVAVMLEAEAAVLKPIA